jgi:hypothetical protein
VFGPNLLTGSYGGLGSARACQLKRGAASRSRGIFLSRTGLGSAPFPRLSSGNREGNGYIVGISNGEGLGAACRVVKPKE